MERYCLPALALPPLMHEALTVIGVGAALVVGFVVINFGLLLPGLFDWLERRLGDSRHEGAKFDHVARFQSTPNPPPALPRCTTGNGQRIRGFFLPRPVASEKR
jgi:hypothetical protein